MLSAIFLVFAVIHFSIWVWGWTLWAKLGRPWSLFLIVFGGSLLAYDNIRIGSGRFIGEGELLQMLTVPAFVWHWTLLPLLVIAAGSIARDAGLEFAQKKWVMGAFCVVAVGMSALDIPKALDFDLYPACVADTVRYTTNVSAEALCSPDGVVVEGGPGAALVAILVNVIVLAVGIVLWVRRGWPWMAAGAGVMFIAAGAFASSPWSLPIANFGEIFITLGLIVTAAHFARRKSAESPAVVSTQRSA